MEMVPAGVMVVVIPRMVVMVLSGTRPVAQPRDHEGCADAQDQQARQQGELWGSGGAPGLAAPTDGTQYGEVGSATYGNAARKRLSFRSTPSPSARFTLLPRHC